MLRDPEKREMINRGLPLGLDSFLQDTASTSKWCSALRIKTVESGRRKKYVLPILILQAVAMCVKA